MPRVGVPANFHGKKGRSGRTPVNKGMNVRIAKIRELLHKAVIDDIAGKKVNPRALFWAEKFANRLLPNPVEIVGKDGGDLVVKVVQFAGD